MTNRRSLFIIATQAILPIAATAAFGFTAFTHTEMTTTIETAPKAPSSAPAWDLAEHVRYAGCVDSDTKVKWIPRAIVIQTRDMLINTEVLYNDAQVALINRTWDDLDGANDTFIIGKCR